MKASKRVSYPCDTCLILIITSYPIVLEVRTEGSRGKCTCFTPKQFSITGTVLMLHVSEFVPGVLSIYLVKTLEEHARSATHIVEISILLQDVIHKCYATYRIPGARLLLIIMFPFLGSTRSVWVVNQQSKQWPTDWAI